MFRFVALLIWFTLAGAVMADTAALTLMRIAPITAKLGESQVIKVEVDCSLTGCSAIDVVLSFDPAILRVDELVVGSPFGDDVYLLENHIDNTNGVLRLAAAALGDPPLTADTTLLEIHVTLLQAGTTAFKVEHIDLGDLAGNPLAVEPEFAPIEVLAATCEYRVKAGDTLLGIAIGNRVTVDSIVTLNNIEDTRFIYTGSTLIIPAVECQAAVGGRSNVIEVYNCEHVGHNVFEWYTARVEYDSAGNPINETMLSGPHSGAWQPGCPAGEPSSPSSGHNTGTSSHDDSQPSGNDTNDDDDDDGGGQPACRPAPSCYQPDYDDGGGVFAP